MDAKKTIIGTIIGTAAVVVAAVVLIYLATNTDALPTGFGLLSGMSDLAKAVVLIAILAVLAIGAWVLMPKEPRGVEKTDSSSD